MPKLTPASASLLDSSLSKELVDRRGKNSVYADGSAEGDSFASRKVEAKAELLLKELAVVGVPRARELVVVLSRLQDYFTSAYKGQLFASDGSYSKVRTALSLNPHFGDGPGDRAVKDILSGCTRERSLLHNVTEGTNELYRKVISLGRVDGDDYSAEVILSVSPGEIETEIVRRAKLAEQASRGYARAYLEALAGEDAALAAAVEAALAEKLAMISAASTFYGTLVNAVLCPLLEEKKLPTWRRVQAKIATLSPPSDHYLFREYLVKSTLLGRVINAAEVTAASERTAVTAKSEEARAAKITAGKVPSTARITAAKTAAEALLGLGRFAALDIQDMEERLRLVRLAVSDRRHSNIFAPYLAKYGEPSLRQLFLLAPEELWRLADRVSSYHNRRVLEIFTDVIFELGRSEAFFGVDLAEGEGGQRHWDKRRHPQLTARNVLRIAGREDAAASRDVVAALIDILNHPEHLEIADTTEEKLAQSQRKAAKRGGTSRAVDGAGGREEDPRQTWAREIDKARGLLKEALFRLDLDHDHGGNARDLFDEAARERPASFILRGAASRFSGVDSRWTRFLDSSALSPEQLNHDPEAAAAAMLAALNDGLFDRARVLAAGAFAASSSAEYRFSGWGRSETLQSDLRRITLHKNLLKDRDLARDVHGHSMACGIRFTTLFSDGEGGSGGSDIFAKRMPGAGVSAGDRTVRALSDRDWAALPEDMSAYFKDVYGPMGGDKEKTKDDLRRLGKMRGSLENFRSSDASGNMLPAVSPDPTIFSRVMQMLLAAGYQGEELRQALWQTMDHRDYMLHDWLEANGGVREEELNEVIRSLKGTADATLPGPWKKHLVAVMEAGGSFIRTPTNLVAYAAARGDDTSGEVFALIALDVARRTLGAGPSGKTRHGRTSELRMVLEILGKNAYASMLAVRDLDWTPKTAVMAAELLHPMVFLDQTAKAKLARFAAGSGAEGAAAFAEAVRQRGDLLGIASMSRESSETKRSRSSRRDPQAVQKEMQEDFAGFIAASTAADLTMLFSLASTEMDDLLRGLDDGKIILLALKAEEVGLESALAGALLSALSRYASDHVGMMVAAAYLLGDYTLIMATVKDSHVHAALAYGFSEVLPAVVNRTSSMPTAVAALSANWKRSRSNIAEVIAEAGSAAGSGKVRSAGASPGEEGADSSGRSKQSGGGLAVSDIELNRLFAPGSLPQDLLDGEDLDGPLAYVLQEASYQGMHALATAAESFGKSLQRAAEMALSQLAEYRYGRRSSSDDSDRDAARSYVRAQRMLVALADGASADDALAMALNNGGDGEQAAQVVHLPRRGS